MDTVFLVCWIEDDPIKFSIQGRGDIADGNLRALPPESLVGLTVTMNWNRRACAAKILKFGTRAAMKKELEVHIQSASASSDLVVATTTAPVIGSANLKKTNKRARIDSVLENIPVQNSENDNGDLIRSLQQELDQEKEEHAKCRSELEKLKEALKTMNSDSIDIGNNIFVKKSVLAALKSVSGTMNVYARHVFKHVFETHEVVGRSLMGKPSNAFKGLAANPALDESKRDAVINHAMSSFQVEQGSQMYRLAMANLKHSLGNLVVEINREAKKNEETTLARLEASAAQVN